MVSSFWAAERVFRVQTDRTWVWPRVNRPEPWTSVSYTHLDVYKRQVLRIREYIPD